MKAILHNIRVIYNIHFYSPRNGCPVGWPMNHNKLSAPVWRLDRLTIVFWCGNLSSICWKTAHCSSKPSNGWLDWLGRACDKDSYLSWRYTASDANWFVLQIFCEIYGDNRVLTKNETYSQVYRIFSEDFSFTDEVHNDKTNVDSNRESFCYKTFGMRKARGR